MKGKTLRRFLPNIHSGNVIEVRTRNGTASLVVEDGQKPLNGRLCVIGVQGCLSAQEMVDKMIQEGFTLSDVVCDPEKVIGIA